MYFKSRLRCYIPDSTQATQICSMAERLATNRVCCGTA